MNGILTQAVPLLLEWYARFKRDLPWRKDKEAYHVWISEIMLQQTRVEAVKDYYLRFLQKFPTVSDLAAADIEEVNKAWQGLGYYTRAANLYKAAKKIAEAGAFPSSWEEVRALPGVGDYTAGAICSIAYDLPCPAVDGNVLRVLTRLLGDPSNADEKKTKEKFVRLLKEVYPREAGDFAQALMELGALVCLPNGEPSCGICPWKGLCVAHAAGKETAFPVKNPKKERRKEEYSLFVYRCGDRFALERRGKGLLGGLWQFPMAEKGTLPRGKILEEKQAEHIFTHIEWKMHGYFAETEELFGDYVWATAAEIEEKYALPSAFAPFLPWTKRPLSDKKGEKKKF